MDERARKGLEVGVGLTLIGLQRWMALRPDIEQELDRLGYGFAADVSRKVGDAVTTAMSRVVASGSS
ncbi:MAG: hypothetical protein AB7W59_07995 [Acidimicrobiia bacterium]